MRVRDQVEFGKTFSDEAREASAEARRKQKEGPKWDLQVHVNRSGNNHALVDTLENQDYPTDGGKSIAEATAKKYGVRTADVSISFNPRK